MSIEKHLDILAFKATDKVTGFKGVIISVSFDAFGCIQALVSQEVKDGKLGESVWFDTPRLKITSKAPVMETPDFSLGYISEGRKGAAYKPAQ